MNIILDIANYNLNCVHFLDSKQNIIIDGKFTKVLYSNELFTMDGICIHFPIELTKIINNLNKTIINFNPYSNINIHIVQEIAKLEYTLIEYYQKMYNKTNVKIFNLLSKQLYSGNIKLYKEYRADEQLPIDYTNNQFIIKISGLWESTNEIGITFKLMSICN
jgi:hypothetical protein